MKRVSPVLVTESVTMVSPGVWESSIAAVRAMRRFLLTKRPSLRTMAARSQSASKSTPRSASFFTTALESARMASGLSGSAA